MSLENYTANTGQTFNVTYILSLFIMIGQHGGSFIFFWLSSVANTNIPLQIATLMCLRTRFPEEQLELSLLILTISSLKGELSGEADEILEALLNPDDYDTCAGVPQYVQEPAAFLIDSNVLKDKKDIRADGKGVWSV
jgi:hypothetical protein